MRTTALIPIVFVHLLPYGGTSTHARDSLRARDSPPPSLVIAPFESQGAPNLAAEVTAGVREGVDSLVGVDHVGWDALIDGSRWAASLDATGPAELGCVQTRQIAASEGIDFVLCGGVSTTAEGFRLELDLFDVGSGARLRLAATTAKERGALVEHTVDEIEEWVRKGGGE